MEVFRGRPRRGTLFIEKFGGYKTKVKERIQQYNKVKG